MKGSLRKILEQSLEGDKVGSYTDIWGKNILSRRNIKSKNPNTGHLEPVQDHRGWNGVREGGDRRNGAREARDGCRS